MANTLQNNLIRQDAVFGVAFALLAAVGFSAKAILVKLAYLDHVDAVTLLALRMAFSVPFFIGVAIWARCQHAAPLTRHDQALVVVLGLIGYYLSSFLDFLGLQYISAGLERLILFLYPTMTVLLTALIYKRAISRTVMGAMVLCYAGIALVFFHDLGMMQGSIMVGALLVFGSTLSYSIYLVGAGHAIARIGASRFTAYAMIVACSASLLQFGLTRSVQSLELPVQVYQLAFGMAVFSTILPIFLLSHAIRRIGSSNTSLIGSIGPISTIFLAYVFLAEGISFMQIAGSTLVLAGVLVISMNSRRIGA